MWKSPTPHELSLERLDGFLASHVLTLKEKLDIDFFYGGSVRVWALRHLRLMAAIEKIEAMKGQPDIVLA
jgi:hypothetical protein